MGATFRGSRSCGCVRIRRRRRKDQRHQPYREVDCHRGERGGRHVEHPQQVKAGDQAAEHAAGNVAAVEEPEPGDALGCRSDPAGNRRQRCAHQHRRRQQAHARRNRAHHDADHAGSGPCRVDAADERHPNQDHDRQPTDAELEPRVHAQRMLARRYHPRQQEAAQAHTGHERTEQDSERDGRRADHELQQLEPDDFVDQRRAAAADEQE